MVDSSLCLLAIQGSESLRQSHKFLATLVALHFAPVSESVGRVSNFEACELVIRLVKESG